MRVSDFYASWTGDGFGGVVSHEAFFDEDPDCDLVDDVCQAFAERVRPLGVAVLVERAACAICGGDLGSEHRSSTCSRACAFALGKTSEPVVVGMVFGALTAVRYVESSNGYVWEFRCTCGSLVVRLATQVRAALRRGSTPGCAACTGARRGVGSLTSTELVEAAERNHRAWARRARKP